MCVLDVYSNRIFHLEIRILGCYIYFNYIW